MTDVNRHDLEAISDVLDWLAEASDSLDAETAIEMYDALSAVINKAKATLSLLETQARRSLDGQPVRVGDAMWFNKPTEKARYDHKGLHRRVAARALFDDKGVKIRKMAEAVDRAVELMAAIYVSPSTTPKKGPLEAAGIDASPFVTWERTGEELKRVPITPERAT